jgi:PleD family two-component response regulator
MAMRLLRTDPAYQLTRRGESRSLAPAARGETLLGSRDTPVVFLSALDDARNKVNAFRAGGVDYMTKPFQADEVLARVDTAPLRTL